MVSVRLTKAVCAPVFVVFGGGFEWIMADILQMFVARAVGQMLRFLRLNMRIKAHC